MLEINKRELSIGEIVSVSHSFQDMESIERFYSKMFGVASFTKECETIEVESETGKRFTLGHDHPDFRKKGIARALVRTAESWSRSKGCEEFGSDARVDDNGSIAFHNSVGFRETDRQIVFLKTIGD